MMRLPFLCLLLSLSLGLSTVGFGVARGQAPVAGDVVICTGHGIVTISVDAEGNPVSKLGLCPDAALVFHAAVDAAPLEAIPLETQPLGSFVPRVAQISAAATLLTRGARGPPA